MSTVVTDIESGIQFAAQEFQEIAATGLLPPEVVALGEVASVLAVAAVNVLAPLFPASAAEAEAPNAAAQSAGKKLYYVHIGALRRQRVSSY